MLCIERNYLDIGHINIDVLIEFQKYRGLNEYKCRNKYPLQSGLHMNYRWNI